MPQLPKRAGKGRPSKAEAREREKAKRKIQRDHERELARREAERKAKELELAEQAKKQGEELARAGGEPIANDPLASIDRLLKMLLHTADLALRDPSLSSTAQRAEVRAIARAAMPLVPASRLLAGEKIVRGALDRMGSSGPKPTLTKPIAHAGAPLQMPRRDG